MYSTCIFCHADLGRNDALEHFPVGRRLAYDEAKGRLWAVCRRCQRWNLSPLETRWEAIEEAERAFRAVRMRISTENIALARLNEGLELVRIGAPPRLEMAGWRYGDQFGRRRRKYMLAGGLTATAVGLIWLGVFGVVAPVVGMGAVGAYNVALQRWLRREGRVPRVFLDNGHGGILPLAKLDAAGTTLLPRPLEAGWILRVPHRLLDPALRAANPWSWVTTILEGEAARLALAKVLPHANMTGGSAWGVRRAVSLIESASSLDALLRNVAGTNSGGKALAKLPAPTRLALEMVVHDDAEQRAMEGELAELERQWREAEQIAGIADALLAPADLDARLAALRRTAEPGPSATGPA